jgi:hypothetical protein
VTLLDTIRDTFSGEKAMARRIYSTIVGRDGTDAAKPSDSADLAEAMKVLGYAPDVLERHLAARREVAELEPVANLDADQLAAALAQRQQERQAKAAGLRQHRRDLLRQFREATADEQAIAKDEERDDQRTHAKLYGIRTARRRVAQLRRDNAIAFSEA